MSGFDFPAGQTRPFHVSPAALGSCVEAWSGYPLQFGGMRRHGWQDELAAELGRALAGEVTITPDARGRHVETSGELFTLRPRVRDTSVRATQRP